MSRYATASDCVPEPCIVANTVLKPFCLGHHLLMKRLGLPFAGNPLADAGQEDVVLGIAICAGSYRETLSDLLCGSWGGKVARWRRRAIGGWWRRSRVNLDRASVIFRSYLAVGYEQPPIIKRNHGANTLSITAPWEELLFCYLVREGFSPEDVIDGYLPAMWYHYYTLMEIFAAETCKDAKTWKRVFVTREMAETLGRL